MYLTTVSILFRFTCKSGFLAYFLYHFKLQIKSSVMILSQLFKTQTRFNKSTSQQRMNLFVEVFQNNYKSMIQFIPYSQQHQIKMTCRGVYYLSITCDIWCGLKVQVVDKKMENFEDIEFVEEETKIITKQQKQIRIHSLKKSNQNIRLREASNIKQKKVAMNTINNQLHFRSTEIGFKRLLKTNTASKQKISSIKESENITADLIDVPKQWTIKDLLINVKEPWSLNVQRASNLCFVVKRWNEYHHRIILQLKFTEKDLSNLIKKSIKVDKQLTQYFQQFQCQPYNSLKQQLSASEKQLLIDERLNKLGNIFVTNHNQLLSISKAMEQFISKSHETLIKLSKIQFSEIQSAWLVQYLSTIQQLIQQYSKIAASSPELIQLVSKSILQIIDGLLEQFNTFQVQSGQIVEIQQVGLSHICKRSDFFEILFQSLQNCISGSLKICEGKEEEMMGMNLTIAKFKSLKNISHHLWNISKYLAKLAKQLQTKEKKGASNKQTSIIRSFLQSYHNHKTFLYDWKNPQKVEKQVLDLKQKVSNLKGMMQGE